MKKIKPTKIRPLQENGMAAISKRWDSVYIYWKEKVRQCKQEFDHDIFLNWIEISGRNQNNQIKGWNLHKKNSIHKKIPTRMHEQRCNDIRHRYSSSSHLDTYCESEFTLELQSRVAPSLEYVTTNMDPTWEAILEEGGWKKKFLYINKLNVKMSSD